MSEHGQQPVATSSNALCDNSAMSTNTPLTLTLAELAERWKLSPQQVLQASPPLPMYFYFDGLVFEFGDKWHRANGDAAVLQDLDSAQSRLSTLEIDLQRQTLHKLGLLKLTQWEEALSDDALRQQQAEAARLRAEVERMKKQLKQRTEQRQRQVRNGLLRLAPRILHDLAVRGQAPFPQFAYLPQPPEGAAAETINIAAGALVALEDGFPRKDFLSSAELVVTLPDVQAHEQRRH